MSNELIDYVNNHMVEIEPNTFEIVNPNNMSFNGMARQLNHLIINEKEDYITSSKNIDINNLFMVRANFELPDELTYKSYKNMGKYIKVQNPLKDIIDIVRMPYELKKELHEKTKLVCPVYRDTVHYAINGLVSDVVNYKFTNRECTIIEPLKDHLNDRLVNINPADTFINVKDQNEPISKNAIYIFSKQYYANMSEELKEKIKNSKKYIYDENKYTIYENSEYNSLETVIVDFVLCHNNILPTHTHGQAALWTESYEEYNDAGERTYHCDEEYLKMFQDLIDKISIEKFGISYYNAEEEMKNLGGIYKQKNYYNHTPGVLHSDTIYYDEEKIECLKYQKDVIKRYIEFIKVPMGFSNELVDTINGRIEKVFNETDIHSFPITNPFIYYNELEKNIDEQTISKFIELTEKFNENERMRLKNIKRMFSSKSNTEELNQMMNETIENKTDIGQDQITL